MPPDELDCPYCPKTASRDESKEPPQRRLAQHILQSQDHDCNLYEEAMKQVESHNSESEGGDEPAEGDEPPETDATGQETETPPHHTSPAVHFEDSARTNREGCPECGSDMERVGSGLNVAGKFDGEAVGVTTEEGDKFCGDCRVIKSNDGKVITNVR